MNKKILKKSCAALLLVGSIFLTGCGEQGLKVADYNVDDYVTLGQYKGLEIEYEGSFLVTEEEIRAEVDNILKQSVSYNESSRTEVQNEDFIVMDYTGSIDGVEFEGGKATDASVQVGHSGFIDNFDEQLVGATVGETFNVNVTFPEKYGDEKLNGKAAVFAVTVKKIYDQIVPTLNDEFVQKISSKSKTVEEFRKEVGDTLQEYRNQTVISYKNYYAQETAIKNATVKEFPKNYLEKKIKDYKDAITEQAKKAEKSYEDYIKENFNLEKEDFEKKLQDYMKESASASLIIEAIQKKENLTLSDEEFAKKAEEYATNKGYESVDKMYESIKKEDLKNYLEQAKVLDFIGESATIVEKK